MVLKEYERLYTPSEWSKRYESEELCMRFFKFCEEGKIEAYSKIFVTSFIKPMVIENFYKLNELCKILRFFSNFIIVTCHKNLFNI